MLNRLGFSARRLVVNRPSVRFLTTQTTITDQGTGRVITLTDPNRPEIADYPNPAPEFSQHRSPYDKFDDPQNRRNLNEPLNIDADMYDMWSPDYHSFVDDKTALLHNAIFLSTVAAIAAGIWYFQLNPEKPAMPRSYPFNGLAKDLGATGDEDAAFYRVRPDTTAEEELGFLKDDEDVIANKKAYEAANADFIKA